MPRTRASESVDVVGLDSFRKALKELGGDWTKALAKANKDAAQVVADRAEQKARALGGVAAKVAPSIKAAAQARQAVVSTGSNAYPMALGAEFGAIRWRQFKPWRGNQWNPDSGGVGWFLHPAIRETRDEFEKVYGDAIERIAHDAFPD